MTLSKLESTAAMRVLSVNVGVTRAMSIKGRAVQTGIHKTPETGPVPVSRFGLRGDARIEPRKMGLEHHAVYAYPHEHYAYWQEALVREPFPFGQFGENLTVTGLLEDEVRIGDVFRIGSAVLQVAQPRIPCAKLNQRMGLRFSSMFLASRKVGYYFRVLHDGNIAPGDNIELLERDTASPTMEEFVRVTQFESWDAQALQRMLRARDLMPAWRETIEAKLTRTLTANGWHGLREFEVVRRDLECEDTVSLYLKCARGRPLTAYHGGQQLVVVLGGRSANQQRRSYALSGSPLDLSTYRISVRRMTAPDSTLPDGAVSSHLFGLKVHERILCAAPMGALPQALDPARSGRVPVLVGQDIGIAPMLSLLYELEAKKVPVVWLFYQMASPEPQGLLRETLALIGRNPGFRFIRSSPDLGSRIDAQLICSHVRLGQADMHIAGRRDFVEGLAGKLREAGLASSALMMMPLS